ncbi:tetratricopeptide repeat protein [bacterium]|nr:tetratricopeptide repeat protein [bacterium]
MQEILRSKYNYVIITLLGLSLIGFGSSPSEAQIENPLLTNDEVAYHDIALDHFLAGTIHEEAGDLLQAVYEYQLALLFDVNSVEIRMSLARVYDRLNQREAAIIILEQGREIGVRNTDLLEMLAEYYLRLRYFSEAADCYLEISTIRDLEQLDLRRLAVLLNSCGRLEEALDVYNQYLDRFEPNVDVYQGIGRIYLKLRDLEAAERVYKQLIEIDPGYPQVFYVLGGMAAQREDWLSAEDNFRHAVELDSSDIEYWISLLMILSEQEKYEEVLEVVAITIERFVGLPLFYDTRSGTLEKLGRLDEAIEAANKSIELDSTRVSPYLIRGYLYHLLGQWEEGAASYERALEIDPDSPAVLNNYAYLLSVQNYRLEDGLEMVDRALEMSPETPSYHDTRAWILYRLGRLKEALEVIKTAMKDSDDNAEIFEHLGYIYQALGKERKALKAWKRAAELEPDNEQYQQLLQSR